MTDTTYNLSISSNNDGKSSMNTNFSTSDVEELKRVLALSGITSGDDAVSAPTDPMSSEETCSACGEEPCACAVNFGDIDDLPMDDMEDDMEEGLEPWMGKDMEHPAYLRKQEFDANMYDATGGGPAIRTVKDECPMCQSTPCRCDGGEAVLDETCAFCEGNGADHMGGKCGYCNGTGSRELDEEMLHDYGHSMSRLAKYQSSSNLKPITAKQNFGKQADNTWKDDPEQVLDHLTESYAAFLLEADIDLDAGTQSPLTADSRNKFDRDPQSNDKVVDDGSRSPMSSIKRQKIYK